MNTKLYMQKQALQWLDDKVQKEIIKLYLTDEVIKILYDKYVVAMNKQKVNDKQYHAEIKTLKKEIAKKEKTTINLMNSISSGEITGAALKGMANKYNELNEDIEKLKESLAEEEAPKHYRILTYDYFKALCKQDSKVLAHSLLPQRRTFVEKCIEAVILDPVKKEVHVKLDISPFLTKSDEGKGAKNLEVSVFDTSSEMVAGAGFEPTTFGL